jgi:hypothetical protein
MVRKKSRGGGPSRQSGLNARDSAMSGPRGAARNAGNPSVAKSKQAGLGVNGRNSGMFGKGAYQPERQLGRVSRHNRLTDVDSAMTPVPSMQRPGRSLPSVILNARSSTPVSILNGGTKHRQTFGPLAWRGDSVDFQGGVKRPFRGARGSKGT